MYVPRYNVPDRLLRVSRPQIGQIVNSKYRLVRLIGEGGMGSVYEARHEYLQSNVALKFLNTELARRPGLVARFLQEARVSASIRSPHVVLVSDVDQTPEGLPFMVMELLDGENLSRTLERSGRLAVATALDYAVQILNGLEAAHAVGVVHRDLKPENVFVVPTRQGQLLKLLDFGIAKLRVSEEFQKGLTRPGVTMGTPEYMAPEQAFSADTADHRADLYSLGVIVFELLIGRRPIGGDDPRVMAAAVLAGRIPSLCDVDPSISPALSATIRKAMSGSPSDRFGSAAELRNALLPFTTILPQTAGLQTYPIQATPQPTGVHAQAVLKTQPDPEPLAGGVAPTLPPDAPDGNQPIGKTGTMMGGPPSPVQAPAGGTQFAPSVQMAAPQMMHPQTSQQAIYAQPPVRKSKSMGWLWGLLAAGIGALLMLGIVVVLVLQNRTDSEGRDTNPIVTPPTVTTITSPPNTTQAPTTGVVTPPTNPPVTTPVTPVGTNTNHPQHRADGGADAGEQDGGATRVDAGFPFPFPSTLPSAFPFPVAIPSGLPQLPIPGWNTPQKP
jgi:serine/threonine protein kinase